MAGSSSTSRMSSAMVDRHGEAERGAVRCHVLDPDGAAVGLHDRLADGESDPGRAASPTRSERFEDLAGVEGIDSLAFVAHRYLEAITVEPGRHRDRAA